MLFQPEKTSRLFADPWPGLAVSFLGVRFVVAAEEAVLAVGLEGVGIAGVEVSEAFEPVPSGVGSQDIVAVQAAEEGRALVEEVLRLVPRLVLGLSGQPGS